MATEGFLGYYVETRDYKATAAFWKSLGFENVFDTDHASGQWRHPNGGPYVFINEQHDAALETHPILHVIDSVAFAPDRAPEFSQAFTPQHWGVVEALVRDPDGRNVSLQAPLPEGIDAPDADAHHNEKYGAN
jgi:catechol 2,3-dioxygenase-like lactoylglutathione lyase family enzyme